MTSIKRKFTILAGTTSVILSLISQPAVAAWTEFVSVQSGAIFSSNPSCSRLGANQVICAALGAGNELFASRYNGSAWTAFERVAPGAVFTSDPSCDPLGTNQVSVPLEDLIVHFMPIGTMVVVGLGFRVWEVYLPQNLVVFA